MVHIYLLSLVFTSVLIKIYSTVSGFQAVVQTLREDEANTTAISDISISRDVARLSEVADISEGPEDDDNGKHSTALSLPTFS